MSFIEDSWYRDSGWTKLLNPLSLVYGRVAKKRRDTFLSKQADLWQPPVPVVVVGNISVGGTGKTPVTLALIEYFKSLGYKPGVISRGYGGKAPSYPYEVLSASSAAHSGDEPLLIKQRTNCCVVVDPDRVAAAKYLLSVADCDLIISDDGLQHYALLRHIELAVVDGERGLGNGRLLPAGPLRESAQRLNEVDFVLVNGGQWSYPAGETNRFRLIASRFINVKTGDTKTVNQWAGASCHAVAGIGNPQRFFNTLAELKITIKTQKALPDHHKITEHELIFNDELPVLVTEKDAVKCRDFANDKLWYLSVDAQLPAKFLSQLKLTLDQLRDQTL
ncbi:MAG: tetraacyldisaccharide 4'-kinase [Flavobacteriales bacterium]